LHLLQSTVRKHAALPVGKEKRKKRALNFTWMSQMKRAVVFGLGRLTWVDMMWLGK